MCPCSRPLSRASHVTVDAASAAAASPSSHAVSTGRLAWTGAALVETALVEVRREGGPWPPVSAKPKTVETKTVSLSCARKNSVDCRWQDERRGDGHPQAEAIA